MPITPHARLSALIRVDASGSGTGLEDLGYSVNGVDVLGQGFWDNVYSDRNGGEAGPPVDVSYLGETAEIRMLLSEWEETVLNKIWFNRLAAGTQGEPGTPGTLMFTDGKESRLLLLTTNVPLNFPRVIFRDNQEINVGARHSRVLISATAYKDAGGVLVNNVIA